MRRVAAVVVCSVLAAGCGGTAVEDESPVDTETTVTQVAMTSSSTSSTTTTSTLPPTTTTTTQPPTPAELKDEFDRWLNSEGWVEYSDSVKGWSIHYPADWEVVIDDPDDRHLTFGLAAADGGLLLVSVGLDALDDSGSPDYLEKSVEYAVNDGTLNPPGDDGWFWLDHDFDGVQGLLDIAGVQASLPNDPLTGETLPEGAIAPSWWYGYYNPDAHPDYGYIFQTIGAEQSFFNVVDLVVLSFSPPEQ